MQTTLAAATWNTRRRYTEHGQRVGAVKITPATICFHDLDRGISGVIDNAEAAAQLGISALVMRRYDEGSYRQPHTDAEREGCRRAETLVTRPKAPPLPAAAALPLQASA